MISTKKIFLIFLFFCIAFIASNNNSYNRNIFLEKNTSENKNNTNNANKSKDDNDLNFFYIFTIIIIILAIAFLITIVAVCGLYLAFRLNNNRLTIFRAIKRKLGYNFRSNRFRSRRLHEEQDDYFIVDPEEEYEDDDDIIIPIGIPGSTLKRGILN